MIRAILFDLDGVLVDSEAYEQKMNARFLKDHGFKSDISAFTSIIGLGAGVDWRAVLKSHLDPEDNQDYLIEKWAELVSGTRSDYAFDEIMFPEVPEALARLKSEGYQLAVCSSSKQEYVDNAVRLCGIGKYLDLAVSGYQFERGKPFPDVYFHARDFFGLTSEECLVIEDSVNGILAGKNAGMPVAARKDNTFGMDQSQADYIIDDLNQIEDVIASLSRK